MPDPGKIGPPGACSASGADYERGGVRIKSCSAGGLQLRHRIRGEVGGIGTEDRLRRWTEHAGGRDSRPRVSDPEHAGGGKD